MKLSKLLARYFKRYGWTWPILMIIAILCILFYIIVQPDLLFIIATFLCFGSIIFGILHVHGYKHAFTGIYYIVRYERNFIIELFIAFFVTVLGFYFQIEKIEWVILVFAITLVLFAEAINSVIEAVCDAITLEQNYKIKYAKDVASGAVLVTGFCALIIGAIIFMPYILDFLANKPSL